MSERTLFNEEALSVGQLYRRSKNALARDFRGPVWISGEIKAMREMRGNLYLQLVEPGDFNDGSDISVDVAVWTKRHLVLKSHLNDAGIKLAAGMMVRIQGTVTLSKFGKLQVELIALDTEALVGRQAAEKRKLYQALAAEGLLEANKSLPMPAVPLRIGLVTSEGSEGHNDFVGQLNRSPFAFVVTLHHSSVQGPTAASSVARAISSFTPTQIDVICVVRGGGGELDAFDKESVARAIATSAIPVWTGIGHTGDRAVADDVAMQFFITPTECGQGLVKAVAHFVEQVEDKARRLSRLVEQQLQMEASKVAAAGHKLRSQVNNHLDSSANQLHRAAERALRCVDKDLAMALLNVGALRRDLHRGSSQYLNGRFEQLERTSKYLLISAQRCSNDMSNLLIQRRAHLSAFDPVRQLQRGYSITRTADGKMVRQAEDVAVGVELTSIFAWGKASSTVKTVSPEEP